MTSIDKTSVALPFTKVSQDHSIKEASAAIFLLSPLDDPRKFVNFSKDNQLLGGTFDKHRIIRKRQQTFNSEEEDIQPKEDLEAGFSLMQTSTDETVSSIFQGINESKNRTYISFHELQYIRWANFKARFIQIIEEFEPLLKEYCADAIGLTYKDEFISNNGTPFPYELLFKNNTEYIPSIIFREQNTDAEISLTLNMRKSGYRFLVKLHILPISNEEKVGVRINHTAVCVLNTSENADNIPVSFKNTNLMDVLQASHELNKDLLKSILTDEVIETISLT